MGATGTGGKLIAGLTIASVVARLIGGVVADQRPLIRLAVGFGTVQALGLVLLSFVDSGALLVACAVIFGATIGNMLMLQPLLFAEAMGTRDYARIFAFNQLIVVAGRGARSVPARGPPRRAELSPGLHGGGGSRTARDRDPRPGRIHHRGTARAVGTGRLTSHRGAQPSNLGVVSHSRPSATQASP